MTGQYQISLSGPLPLYAQQKFQKLFLNKQANSSTAFLHNLTAVQVSHKTDTTAWASLKYCFFKKRSSLEHLAQTQKPEITQVSQMNPLPLCGLSLT